MFKQIAYVWKREWRYIFRNRRLLGILLGVPLLYCTLFGILYYENTVNQIPLGVLDLDNSSLSRAVIRAFQDSDRFRHVMSFTDQKELEQAMHEGKIMVALFIPPNFSKEVKTGKGSKVTLITNGTNLIIANTSLTAASEIVQTLSGATLVRYLEKGGMLPEMALRLAQPISFQVRVWYNPTLNYSNFLLLGLIATITQQVALLYVAIAIVREKELGTLAELKAHCSSVFAITLGKILPYFVFNLVTLNLLFAEAVFLFRIPFRGSYPLLLLLTACFLACILSFGVMVSALCRNELEATQIAMLFAVPSFLFSGFTWPFMAMPLPAKILGHLMPLTYYAENVRKIFLMNAGLTDIAKDLGILTLMTLFCFGTALVVVKRKYFGAETEDTLEM
ncbi:ABC-2 type transporter [Ammonifex degensii KC4]|uniref:ABC-2 type transporter n=1 Tax=Ammonifex degensii (strain DSM 10501 / KC4) TaxID=429009 RepID=C9RD00_AMMDK|nr:ABC transporter permease [Ammonifex degensii]ACX52127.1 ABC-2 type transporter [Ammonifex degensii KC4]